MMLKRISLITLCSITVLIIANSCKHKPYINTYGGFPDDVGEIFITKCATSGCHNAASYKNAGGLLLDSWDHLFDGAVNGAVVIAYAPKYSSLLYFINADSTNGDLHINRGNLMPQDGTPLSATEYAAIKNWIAKGAPDRNGNIPFADNASARQKIYLTNQGTDMVAVIDAEKKVVMRMIQVGKIDGGTPEAPHCVRVSPNPNDPYAYVSFSNGEWLQKINTNTDKIENELKLPAAPAGAVPSWNVFTISHDGSKVLISDWRTDSRVVLIDAASMSTKIQYANGFQNPHGLTASPNFDTFYITAQYGNIIYKLPAAIGSSVINVSLDGNPPSPVTGANTPDPHEIMMLPGNDKYLVTCQKTNEVKLVDAHTNAVLFTKAVGSKPQEIALSTKNHLAYISCQVDNVQGIFQGSVYVLDYTSPTLEQKAVVTGMFNQPHGLAVDDQNDALYVASQNTNGPAPHHPSTGNGPNGYYQVFSSIPPCLQLNSKTYEVSVQPYSMDVRFK
ncbi:MAG: hypothetical protein JST82_08165 [Bacteroidetes bacterium]|nr:hypothetical protein [Bacteroidota bacterium]